MTQGVSQSKREFAPSLIFLSMAPTLLSCGIPERTPQVYGSFAMMAHQARSWGLSTTMIWSARQMHKTHLGGSL
jgi:hypothetical protein